MRNDPPKPLPDEPVKIDLDPEEALKALLKVDPEAEPVEDETKPKERPKDAKDIYGESWIDRS